MNENTVIMKKEYSCVILVVFAFCVSLASQKGIENISVDGVTILCNVFVVITMLSFDKKWWNIGLNIPLLFFFFLVRFILYMTVIHIVESASNVFYNAFTNGTINFEKFFTDKKKYTSYFMLMGISWYLGKGKLIDETFFYFTIAYSLIRYLEKDTGHQKKKSFISYGVGLACNFYEGYLIHILPNDGAQFGGFEKNIERYEAVQKVTFPVKKLFVIITKKLYCPPDLADFNKFDKNLPYLEACSSLEDVEKDVAGVKNRKYRNSIYKICQKGVDPVYLAVECATPLHTLQKVKERRAEYKELADANFEEIVDDFCKTLQSIIDNSRSCYKKVELVYYDESNPNLNLADILLQKIQELEPSFQVIK